MQNQPPTGSHAPGVSEAAEEGGELVDERRGVDLFNAPTVGESPARCQQNQEGHDNIGE